jgi:hypothetical protein
MICNCCIVDGYFCCVVDRHFFFLQDYFPKRDEVTGEWRKLRNEELSDL